MEGETSRLAIHHHAHAWTRCRQHAVDVEYRTTRIILLVLTIIHRRFQLATGQRDQRIDESPQFRGQRRIVQFQSKRDRPRHAAKDHVELLSGGVGEQFAGLPNGVRRGIGVAFGGGRRRRCRRCSVQRGSICLRCGLLVGARDRALWRQTGFLAHPLGVPFQLHCGNSAIGGGSNHLSQVLGPQITGCIHARHRGFEIAVRDHVTIIVQFHHAAHQIRGGHISGEHEHAERATVSRFPRFGLASGPV